jgi:hypothetical protein
LLHKYGLKEKIIVYVKDEGYNINVMVGALKSIVNYESFGLEESFYGTCSAHVFSKACQYGTAKEKVCKNFKYVSIKFAQVYLQKCITWLKKSMKGIHEWNKSCIEIGILPKFFNTLVKTR